MINPERPSFEAEPWNDHVAIDALIALQQQAFVVEMSDDQTDLGVIYLRMSDIESSINNYGEAASYAYDAAETYEQAGSTAEAISSWCIVSRARCRMGLPELGYDALIRGIEMRKHLSNEARDNFAQEDDMAVIARHTPLRLPDEPEQVTGGGEMSVFVRKFLKSIAHRTSDTFQDWIRQNGATYVANQLRKLDVATQASDDIIPLVPLLHILLSGNILPKSMHEKVFDDLESLFDFGPYLFMLRAESTMRALSGTYLAFSQQPKLKRKSRKLAYQRSVVIAAAHNFYLSSGPHFNGLDAVPQPVDSIKALVEKHQQFITNLYNN